MFGCARVVFNDGLRVRRAAREQGLPYVSGRRVVVVGHHVGQGDSGAGRGWARCRRWCRGRPSRT
ncbi:helix-turn-helix domain-containing protein [Micromonospora sp. LOL_028]|uniref:helix-turn-helix domain-containing protein n=1 Tax=Micromonospora sp. LOL_028 TaxID=3345420 RepID=UPI003A8422D6